jgi:hypothetical protein
MPVTAPAFAVMVIPVAIVVAAIRLRADRGARRRADDCANRRAASAADRGTYAGTDTGANKRAANGVLCTSAGWHRCESSQSNKSENGLPHGILQPMDLLFNAALPIRFQDSHETHARDRTPASCPR